MGRKALNHSKSIDPYGDEILKTSSVEVETADKKKLKEETATAGKRIFDEIAIETWKVMLANPKNFGKTYWDLSNSACEAAKVFLSVLSQYGSVPPSE